MTTLRFDAEMAGEHVHITLWGGANLDHLALCGRFTLSLEEYDLLKDNLHHYLTSYGGSSEMLIVTSDPGEKSC